MGIFGNKQEWINPDEYTINEKSKTKAPSSILSECVYDKNALAALCSLVCPSVPPTRQNLKVIATSAAQMCTEVLKHGNKFYAAALSTSDPKKFFMNMEVVRRDVALVRNIQAYFSYGFYVPNTCMYVDDRFQIEVRHLVDRAFAALAEAKNPAKLAEKHIAVYMEHFTELDDKSKEKIAKKYKKYMEQ